MSEMPIFPIGMVKQYKAPKSYYNTFDIRDYTFEQYAGQTKFRTQKFNNILLRPEMAELKAFCEESAMDFLDNVLQMEYEEFFITETRD